MARFKRIFALLSFVLLNEAGYAQNPPADSAGVAIIGRVVDYGGRPTRARVNLWRVEPDGLLYDPKFEWTDSEGMFRFAGSPDKQYLLALDGGRNRSTFDTVKGAEVNLGELRFEQCTSPAAPNFMGPDDPATADPGAYVVPEQIVIEAQTLVNGQWKIVHGPSRENMMGIGLPNWPPCWRGPDVESHLSIGKFLGKVRSIRVTGHSPSLTPVEIQDEIRRVWLSTVTLASNIIVWSEGSPWNVEAVVEFDDGRRNAILMDGWVHLFVKDLSSNNWLFLRTSAANQ